MNELLGDVLMIIGAIFLLLTAVGVLRMPDLFTRMQPVAKGRRWVSPARCSPSPSTSVTAA